MGAPRPPRAPAFALTVPGIGPILRSQAVALGLRTGAVEFDGRADVVPLGVAQHGVLYRLRTAEDLFADVAVLPRRGTATATAAGVDRRALEAGLEYLQRLGGRLERGTFRVVVRVLDERRYNRTTLRDAVTRRLQVLLPAWRPTTSGGEVELWILQTGPTTYRVGLRITCRRRPSRVVERAGALRPAVAAAMVHLAGRRRGVLLDPCCGTGTILEEARAVGWTAIGGDVDTAAIRATAANTGAAVVLLDGRHLPVAADACTRS